MNLRRWTWDRTKGMLLGVITPLFFVPIVLLILSWTQAYEFSYLWHKFSFNDPYRIKILTISIISNLIWFYFFLNRERWEYGRGIIFGSLVYAPYVIYVKFF